MKHRAKFSYTIFLKNFYENVFFYSGFNYIITPLIIVDMRYVVNNTCILQNTLYQLEKHIKFVCTYVYVVTSRFIHVRKTGITC